MAAITTSSLRRPHRSSPAPQPSPPSGAREIKISGGEAAIVWPAPSTMGDLLRREGLSKPRRRQRRPVPLTRPFLQVCEPNDRWCIDFKGWFRTGDGQRCDPLTLTDAYSRFLIECRIVPPTTEGVWALVDRAFGELGLPRAIRSDNGIPFACTTSAGGLTRLSVHWVKLGIELERIEPGKPQQNGRHERMHGTLKAETSRPPAAPDSETHRAAPLPLFPLAPKGGEGRGEGVSVSAIGRSPRSRLHLSGAFIPRRQHPLTPTLSPLRGAREIENSGAREVGNSGAREIGNSGGEGDRNWNARTLKPAASPPLPYSPSPPEGGRGSG